MKFPAFAYARPTSIDEALELLAGDEDARPLAGGQTLLPILALRMATPSCLVDLGALTELKQIALHNGHITVGAMVTHAQNLRATEYRTHLPIMHTALRHVAHAAVRNRGTMGGSIAYADAAAEMPLLAVVLDATMIIANTTGTRSVAAADFFAGHYATAIEPGDLLTHIEFPTTTMSWAFEEISRREGDFALVMAAAGVKLEDNRCAAIRIGIGSVADRPVRAAAAEDFLLGKEITDAVAAEAAQIATRDLRSHADIHASANYRRMVAAVLIKRTLLQANQRRAL